MTLAASTKTPGFSLSEIFGGPGTSSGAAPMRTLLIALAIVSDLSAVENTGVASSVTTTTTAGTAPVNTPTPIFSPDDAAVKFGWGSEMHRGARSHFAQYRTGTLWGIAPAESGGARATMVITPTVSTITGSGTIRVRIAGRVIEVPFGSSDTVSTIGLALAQALNDVPELPTTHTNVWATGAVTATAKNIGPRGNYIPVVVEILSSTASVRSAPGGSRPRSSA